MIFLRLAIFIFVALDPKKARKNLTILTKDFGGPVTGADCKMTDIAFVSIGSFKFCLTNIFNI